LPDGATGIFFREGLDRFLRDRPDLPVGLICRQALPSLRHCEPTGRREAPPDGSQ
jgi:hypothetical protein